MLAHQLDRLAQKDRRSRDFTLNSLRDALREVIACFPVYRSYITDGGVRDADRAVRRDRPSPTPSRRNPTTEPAVFHFIRDMLLLKYPDAFDARPTAPSSAASPASSSR